MQQNKIIAPSDVIFSIINTEGGFVNDPDDHGGPTKYGITLHTLSKFLNRPVTIDELKSLSTFEAYTIFYSAYDAAPHINALPAPIQPFMIDSAVNLGPEQAIKILQSVLLAHGKNIGAIDGICGIKTQSAASCCWTDIGNDLLRSLVQKRIAFYNSIAKQNPENQKFLTGWINRAELFLPHP